MTRLRNEAGRIGETAVAVSRYRILSSPSTWIRGSALLLLLITFGATAAAVAQTPHQAALVIVHGDGRVLTRCIDFQEAQITGADLLQRSGLSLSMEAGSTGAAMCQIDGEGCNFPSESCFCKCEGDSCSYWSYWRLADGAWRYSQQGASGSTVLPGAVEGWVWGAGTPDNAQQPPAVTFAEVCAPPATATATPSSTATQIPSPTATQTPSPATPTTTPAVPTATPTATATAQGSATATATPPAVPPTATLLPAMKVAPTSTPLPPPVIERFEVIPHELTAGVVAVLYWRVTGANAVQLRARDSAMSLPAEGNFQVAPSGDTTYYLVATNGNENVTAAVTLSVRPTVAAPEAPPAAVATALVATPGVATPSSNQPAVVAAAQEQPAQAIVITPLSLPTATPMPTLAPVQLSTGAGNLPATIETAAQRPAVTAGTDRLIPGTLVAFTGILAFSVGTLLIALLRVVRRRQ